MVKHVSHHSLGDEIPIPWYLPVLSLESESKVLHIDFFTGLSMVESRAVPSNSEPQYDKGDSVSKQAFRIPQKHLSNIEDTHTQTMSSVNPFRIQQCKGIPGHVLRFLVSPGPR